MRRDSIVHLRLLHRLDARCLDARESSDANPASRSMTSEQPVKLVLARLAGTTGWRLTMTRGIRQGCPFSPLIFAVVVDVLLRRLARVLQPGGRLESYDLVHEDRVLLSGEYVSELSRNIGGLV